MRIPPLIRDQFESLERADDPLLHLRAIRGLKDWLRDAEGAALEEARERGHTWDEIGQAQGRPRQSVHRQATKTPRRPRVMGLTMPDFVGVGTPDLRFWLRWWSDPKRTPEGLEEAGRDPVAEQEKIRAEIAAREAAGFAGPDRDRSW